MSETVPRHASQPSPWGRRFSGLLLLLAGLTLMAAVLAASYGESSACWTWGLRLGLPGSLLASAGAQFLVLMGGWLMWRSRRGRP